MIIVNQISIVMGEVGFCGGVSRADGKISHIREIEKESLYILGDLIHNESYKKYLLEQDIHSIDSIEEAKDKIVIIRTHGISPEEEKQLNKIAKKVYDLTCPLVKHIQSKARDYSDQGYYVLITGDPKHAETIGIAGYVNNFFVIKNLEDVHSIDFERYPRMVLLTQSTYSQDIFLEIVSLVKQLKADIVIENTLCYAPTNRQDEMETLAKENDMVLVIGGSHSSNTIKLFEKAKKESRTGRVFHVEYPVEIDKIDFTDLKTVGITSGTSTPDFIIQEFIKKIKEKTNDF